MRIGVPQETLEGERRVALIPDTVKSLSAKDIDVTIESGAGVTVAAQAVSNAGTLGWALTTAEIVALDTASGR